MADLQPLFEGDYAFGPITPWNNPRSYGPDCFDQLAAVEHYEKLARKARRSGRFGFANRATREPSRVSPSRPSGRVSAIAGWLICIAVAAFLGFALAVQL
jgi:hypothetical protein